MKQREGKELERENKDPPRTSHSSSSTVCSAALARNDGLLLPAEDHRPEEGWGKRNGSGDSGLEASLSGKPVSVLL